MKRLPSEHAAFCLRVVAGDMEEPGDREPHQPALGSVDDSFAKGDGDRVHARVGPELDEDVANMALHRLPSYEELRRNLVTGPAVCEELKDLALPQRDPRSRCRCVR